MKNLVFKFFGFIIFSIFAFNYIITSFGVSSKICAINFSDIITSFEVLEVGFNSATFRWNYLEDISFEIGDYVNLVVFDNEIGYQGQKPIYSVCHNIEDFNLGEIKSFTSKSLTPNTDYIAKIEYVSVQGTSSESQFMFKTQEFKIINPKVEGVIEEGIIDKKDIKISWEVSSDKFELSENDKIQIFLKEFSDDDFPKTPIFETKENVTSAEVKLANFEKSYDFKIVYTLGDKFIESEIFFADLIFNGLDFKIEEVSMNYAKIVPEFLNKEDFVDESEMEIFLMDDMDYDYSDTPLLHIKGKEEILKFEGYTFENLKFNTEYIAKVKLKVDSVSEFGSETPLTVETEYKFKTKNFEIKDLKIESVTDNICKVNWTFDGEKISFSSGDSLSVYVKDSFDRDYKEPIITILEELDNKTSVDVPLPMYNLKFDIKIVFSVGGKQKIEYISHSIKPKEIKFGISEIQSQLIKFSLDRGDIQFKDEDVVQIYFKKSNEGQFAFKKEEKLASGLTEITVDTLNSNTIYNFKIDVIKDKVLLQEKFYEVKTEENKLQIVDLFIQPESENKVKVTIEYAPTNFEFNNVESLSVIKSIVTENESQIQKQTATDGEEKQEITTDFKTNNQFSITFDKPSNYKLKFSYKFKSQPTLPDITTREGETQIPLNDGVTSDYPQSLTTSEMVMQAPVEKEIIYFHEYRFFMFELRDIVKSEIKINFDFEDYYTPVKGDKIELFMRKEGEADFSKDSLLVLEHEKENVDFKTLGVIDFVGLDAGTEFIFKAKFVSEKYPTEMELKLTTFPIDLQEVMVSHLSDLSSVVKWKLGKDFEFSPNDTLEVFFKKESEEKFKDEPNEVIKELELLNGALIYTDFIDTTYDIKLIFKSGSKSLEKAFKVSTNIEDLALETYDVYETSAYLKWKYPKNYLITDGESISIFLKESSQAEYGEEPYFILEHNEDNSDFLDTFESIKLFGLIPNMNYDVKVFLDFGEVGNKEKTINFKTKELQISDLKIDAIKGKEFDISWQISDFQNIDFEEADKVNVYIKNSEDDWSGNFAYTISQNLNFINGVRLIVEDLERIYDVKVEYSFGEKLISSTMKLESVKADYEETEKGINILLEYPKFLKFEDDDEVLIFIKEGLREGQYENLVSLKHSSSTNLNEIKSIGIEVVSQKSLIGIVIKNKSTNIFPLSIYYISGEENVPTVGIISELVGNGIDIKLPEEYDLNVTSEVRNSIGGRSYYNQLEDGEYVIVIDKIVPGKVYENTIIVTEDVYGEEVTLQLDEFSLEPADLLEEFLYNSYFFAFDRFPDEFGYNYWKENLESEEGVTGKYFLINLMFAEKEFADRNLSDHDLIKALYQIVVNREYDEQGLNYWIELYNDYLEEFNGDKYEAKKIIVMWMVHEPEFGRLCEEMQIKW